MGRDKALLDVGGKTLLARQIELVRELGAAEVFISARADANYSQFGGHVLHDDLLNAGPLAGIARAMSVARAPLLLVLAVDMANLRGEFLAKLLGECTDGVGVVPQVDGMVEPLAAFYPKAAAGLIQELLVQANPGHSPGAKHFAQACVDAGLARFVTVPPAEMEFLKSWNTPEDLRR